MAEEAMVLEESGPELLEMPPDNELGLYEKFTHTDQEYGWLRDRVIIQQQEGPGGKEPVSVSVNGFRCDIPRGIECDIARPYTEVLKNAIETHYEYEEDERGKSQIKQRNVPRFNWSIIQLAVNRDDYTDTNGKKQEGLKKRAKRYIEAENKRRIAAWEASKNGDDS